ncbi:MAG: hypothetical protein M0D53_01445 [Flavobacterium sp. JAD_PAG50586_2]|nr:MAG: hypothetical protein M0D53_01445 [Flavobacterium sp. JAD_PAG50586_2]
MKSILQRLFSTMLLTFSKPTITSAKNELGFSSNSFVRDGKGYFSAALLSTQLQGVFGFIQKMIYTLRRCYK